MSLTTGMRAQFSGGAPAGSLGAPAGGCLAQWGASHVGVRLSLTVWQVSLHQAPQLVSWGWWAGWKLRRFNKKTRRSQSRVPPGPLVPELLVGGRRTVLQQLEYYRSLRLEASLSSGRARVLGLALGWHRVMPASQVDMWNPRTCTGSEGERNTLRAVCGRVSFGGRPETQFHLWLLEYSVGPGKL